MLFTANFIAKSPERNMSKPLAPHTITRLLGSWKSGDQAALEELMPLIYAELHKRARGLMRKERASHTLQPTALINEAYLRLVDAGQVAIENRSDFFAICANLMRQILVDLARSRKALKRGGEIIPVTLDEMLIGSKEQDSHLIALDDALRALEMLSPRQARVVELRYFGGLTVEETAMLLKVSPETVMRDWKVAKVWLLRELKKSL
jgi:RNA polymerase sigma-70 factor, ECF subfamily